MLWQNFMEVMDVRKSWSKSRRPWETYRSLYTPRSSSQPETSCYAKSCHVELVWPGGYRPCWSVAAWIVQHSWIHFAMWIHLARRSHEIHGAWNCQLVLVETKPSEGFGELCELCEPCQPPRNEDPHRQRISKLVKLLSTRFTTVITVICDDQNWHNSPGRKKLCFCWFVTEVSASNAPDVPWADTPDVNSAKVREFFCSLPMIFACLFCHMGVSRNRGSPKCMVYSL